MLQAILGPPNSVQMTLLLKCKVSTVRNDSPLHTNNVSFLFTQVGLTCLMQLEMLGCLIPGLKPLLKKVSRASPETSIPDDIIVVSRPRNHFQQTVE
jgi:hypothetical protein